MKDEDKGKDNKTQNNPKAKSQHKQQHNSKNQISNSKYSGHVFLYIHQNYSVTSIKQADRHKHPCGMWACTPQWPLVHLKNKNSRGRPMPMAAVAT
jgi:hypothetical protein